MEQRQRGAHRRRHDSHQGLIGEADSRFPRTLSTFRAANGGDSKRPRRRQDVGGRARSEWHFGHGGTARPRLGRRRARGYGISRSVPEGKELTPSKRPVSQGTLLRAFPLRGPRQRRRGLQQTRESDLGIFRGNQSFFYRPALLWLPRSLGHQEDLSYRAAQF